MDTVEHVFRKLPAECLEQLKSRLIHHLILKKVFHPFRAFGQYHQVAFDATEVHSYKKEHDGTYKTSNKGYFCITSETLEILTKKGMSSSLLVALEELEGRKWKGKEKFFQEVSPLFSEEEWRIWSEPLRKYSGNTTWHLYVLEAKLVTKNGFAVSIATEWIENGEEYEKQDCESKAFLRISQKIKSEFPRLPILVLADGLYPNDTVLTQCRKLEWAFLLVLKDGNLKSLWEEINALSQLEPEKKLQKTSKKQIQHYRWFCDLEYQNHKISYGECVEIILKENFDTEKKVKFAYVSNIPVTKDNIETFIEVGRQRHKIENQGFKTQKVNGFHLEHKISRNELAFKNWYQCLQIAHLLYQLLSLSKHFREWKGELTLLFLWKYLFAALLLEEIEFSNENKKRQFRYQ